MHSYYLVSHRKTYSRTTLVVVCTEEFRLYFGQVFWGNAAARVADLYLYPVFIGKDSLNSDKPALFRVFYCVVDNVDENLSQPVSVAIYRREILRLGINKLDALLFRLFGIYENSVPKLCKYVHISLCKGEFSVLHSGEIQKLLHHFGKTLCFRGYDPHSLDDSFAVIGH